MKRLSERRVDGRIKFARRLFIQLRIAGYLVPPATVDHGYRITIQSEPQSGKAF